jgi:hypothetical protein
VPTFALIRGLGGMTCLVPQLTTGKESLDRILAPRGSIAMPVRPQRRDGTVPMMTRRLPCDLFRLCQIGDRLRWELVARRRRS